MRKIMDQLLPYQKRRKGEWMDSMIAIAPSQHLAQPLREKPASFQRTFARQVIGRIIKLRQSQIANRVAFPTPPPVSCPTKRRSRSRNEVQIANRRVHRQFRIPVEETGWRVYWYGVAHQELPDGIDSFKIGR